MKIEELYPQDETGCEEKLKALSKPTASVANHVSASSEGKKSKPSSINKSVRVSSTKRRRHQSRHQSASKLRPSSCRMKLEQVNRHEEHSFLLEAETNQAILENIISKDELCRYLSPLKFIEIDSWRRGVPYGLKLEPDGERRKWRSPIEILYAGGAFKGTDVDEDDLKKAKNQVSTSGTYLKLKRRHLFKNVEAKKPNEKETDPEKTDAVGAEGNNVARDALSSAYKTRDVWQRRPATSPDRKVLLSKVKSERILSRNQTLIGSRSRTFGIHDAIASPRGLYNRSSLSSIASLQRNFSPSKPRTFSQENREGPLENSAVRTQKLEFGLHRQLEVQDSSARNSPSLNESFSKTYFPSVRPRTRGKASRGVTASLNKKEKVSLIRNRDPQIDSKDPSPRELNTKLSDFHSDPNIAYIPQSYRIKDLHCENEPSLSRASAAADNTKSPLHSAIDRDQSVAAFGMTQNRRTVTSSDETIRLPRDSLFSSASSPRVDSATPRTIRTNNLLTNRSRTSKLTSSSFQSPWVTQALPDFSNREVAAKAEKEGYYVRKHSKTVSFRVSDSDLDKRRLRPSQDIKKNISMVVVNVDDPTKSIIPHGGATKLPQAGNGFANANVISVRP